jgi:predicted  nucleic acid-binding Zn-ribbon protein
VATLTGSIASAALEHQQELRIQAARYEEQMLNERRAHQDEIRRIGEDLTAANAQISRERERMDAVAREHALAVDRFRQDVKEANQRTDAAMAATAQVRAQADTFRDHASAVEIRAARAEQEMATERAELKSRISDMDRDLMVVQADKHSLASKVANLEETIIANRATEAALRQQIETKGKQ